MLTYAQLLASALQFLQDTGALTYNADEAGYAIKNELKRLSRVSPVLIDVIYQVESRTGAETAGTASKLTDTTKSQFLSTDPTNEKVVHNITDDTWAVVTGSTSTSILSLSADIMDAAEEYEIYNKQCKNKKQINLGTLIPFLWVESVEYPVGTERNFLEVAKDIIELEVEDSTIQDSNSTLTSPNKVDVLVRLALPQVLCKLTDVDGFVHTTAAAKATSIQVKTFTDTEIIEVGELFNIAGHRTTYVVTTQVTLANQASTGSTLAFFPSLEAAATAGDAITFVRSTLQPTHEELLEQLVGVYLKLSDAERHRIQAIADLTAGRVLVTAGTIAVGDKSAENYSRYATAGLQLARELVASALQEQAILFRRLESLANPREARIFSKE